MDTTSRFLPLAGVTAFFAVGFVWRAWLQRRRYGRSGVVLFRTADRRQRLREALFVVFLAATAGQAAAVAAAPDSLSRLEVASRPTGGPWLLAGGLLLGGGMVLMVAAQLRLGVSWRIGIEHGASPGLVTGGLYRLCRNPIFLGMFVLLTGLTVLLPTWASAGILLGSLCCVRSQVLEEEAYLTATYGDSYREYCRKVGRFVPGLGLVGPMR